MSSTHLNLHYHLIFSTKDRKPLIDLTWQDKLHSYLGGTLRTIGAKAIAIGGISDHVRLLIEFRATHRLADLLRESKSSSSKWVHQSIGVKDFAWQDGYAAFTVSASLKEQVRHYITLQQQHHKRITFEQEYLEFLQKSGIEYDERYLW